jgi:hypothetical protein
VTRYTMLFLLIIARMMAEIGTQMLTHWICRLQSGFVLTIVTWHLDRHRFAPIPALNPRTRRRLATVTEKFLNLDSGGQAGLLESEFKKLFARCIGAGHDKKGLPGP